MPFPWSQWLSQEDMSHKFHQWFSKNCGGDIRSNAAAGSCRSHQDRLDPPGNMRWVGVLGMLCVVSMSHPQGHPERRKSVGSTNSQRAYLESCYLQIPKPNLLLDISTIWINEFSVSLCPILFVLIHEESLRGTRSLAESLASTE
jgi:hypothetical protein